MLHYIKKKKTLRASSSFLFEVVLEYGSHNMINKKHGKTFSTNFGCIKLQNVSQAPTISFTISFCNIGPSEKSKEIEKGESLGNNNTVYCFVSF